jgi:hypothetical protein
MALDTRQVTTFEDNAGAEVYVAVARAKPGFGAN